jgi:hypothetical protein
MNKKQEVQMILTRIHSHEYTVKIKDDYYRLTKDGLHVLKLG